MKRKAWNGDNDYRVQRNEPVTKWIADDLRIVRCCYGAEVLESQNCMMYDFDHGVAGFNVLVSERKEIAAFMNFFEKKAKVYFPICEWGLYVTKSGIRIIEVSGYQFDWDYNPDVNHYTLLGKETFADPTYIGLSKRMKDFRLRISPKPKRVLPFELAKNLWKFPRVYRWLRNLCVSHAYFDSTIPVKNFGSEAARYHHIEGVDYYSPHHNYA